MDELGTLRAEVEARKEQVAGLEATLASLQEELRLLQEQMGIIGEVPWLRKYAPHLAIVGALGAAITYFTLRK